MGPAIKAGSVWNHKTTGALVTVLHANNAIEIDADDGWDAVTAVAFLRDYEPSSLPAMRRIAAQAIRENLQPVAAMLTGGKAGR